MAKSQEVSSYMKHRVIVKTGHGYSCDMTWSYEDLCAYHKYECLYHKNEDFFSTVNLLFRICPLRASH